MDHDTIEYAKDNLRYEPDTGNIMWNKHGAGRRSDGIAGTLHHSGYIYVWLKGKQYGAHRLAFLLMGEVIPEEVDHVDGNPSNNVWGNLRSANKYQNMQNTRRSSNNKSGYKGVGYFPKYGKWRARIGFRGKQKFLGYFDTPEEAYKAYCEAANTYHKEFARYE